MKRSAFPLAAAALVGAMLPLSTPGAAHAADDGPAFSGFSTSAWSTPVRLEIYEPTIPIPANPQAEVEFGYTTVTADSSSSRGRASFLWPGGPIGEGAKTVIENLGLPPEISGPLAAQGYPIQVNSTYPSEPSSEAKEPFPGTVMNTTASQDKTVASVGYSSNCDVSDAGGNAGGAGGGGGGGGGGTPGIPGLPGLPGLPTSGGGTILDQLLSPASPSSGKHSSGKHRSGQHTSGRASAAAAADDPAASCQIPAELGALIDFGGYSSTSRSVNSATEVVATSRAALGDISLLGGIVTMSGITAKAESSSNGSKTHGAGNAAYGTMTIGGQEFGFGPGGFTAAGSPAPIPGLPDDPVKALQALGITLTIPAPVYEKDGDRITTTAEGLIVDLDTSVLRKKLNALPLGDLVGQLPDELGQLKSLLGAAVNLSPRYVITLGVASSTVDTVQGLVIPPVVPDNDPDGDNGNGNSNGNGGTTGGTTPPASGTTGTPTGGSDVPSADGDLTDAAPMGAGLPPLFSIPGALLFGGIALATVAGSYFRKIGALALGGGAACPHGLDSGLPDLRKA